jgi:putative YhbY family RNA-binding protein
MTDSTPIQLTPDQRRALKARAHHVEPVVIIGDAGLTPAVLREIDVHLKSHELIKIRVTGDDRDARVAMIDTISEALDASPVQHIGKILVMFRPKPPEPAKKKLTVQKPRARNKQRRTKRSYQGS